MAINSDQEYELEQRKVKWARRIEFVFVQILRVIVAFIKLLIRIVWGVIASILRGMGLNVKGGV